MLPEIWVDNGLWTMLFSYNVFKLVIGRKAQNQLASLDSIIVSKISNTLKQNVRFTKCFSE